MANPFFEWMKRTAILFIGNCSGRTYRQAIPICDAYASRHGLTELISHFQSQERKLRFAGGGHRWPFVQFNVIHIEAAGQWFCGCNRKSKLKSFSSRRICEQKPPRLPAACLPAVRMLPGRLE